MNGRPKLLAYQATGATSAGRLPSQPEQRWRSLFVDEIEHAVIAADHPWQSAHNYSPETTKCVDQIALHANPKHN
jgi:hypothetical protein